MHRRATRLHVLAAAVLLVAAPFAVACDKTGATDVKSNGGNSSPTVRTTEGLPTADEVTSPPPTTATTVPYVPPTTRYVAPTTRYVPPTTRYSPPVTKAAPSCPNGSYTNSDGNSVCSPYKTSDGSAPAGATAQCKDGTYSSSQHRSGTCSGHGGVDHWINEPPS